MTKALLAEDRVHAFSFEDTTDVGMSWYLTQNEVKCLRQEVYSDYNRDQWEKLRLILKEPTDTAESEPTS